MSQSVYQSVVLFMLLAAGYAAGKLKVLGPEAVRGLSRFIVDFSLPALVLVSLQKPFSPELRDQAFRMLGISVAIYFSALTLSMLWARVIRSPRQERGVHEFAGSFANVAFMGFPILGAFFGREILFDVSIYNIPFQFLAFSVGIVFLTRGKAGSLRLSPRQFISPAIIATAVGFLLFLGSVRLSGPLLASLTLLGDVTTPLSMTVIGAVLARMDARGVLGNPRVYLTSAYRLLVLPIATWLVLSGLGLQDRALAVPVLLAAMPVAANATILADAYGGDAETASSLVFVSTVASLATIPFLAWTLFGL
ncbi:MAG TPA: AEC family transporter [Magnetospirillaceae bacterium]|nr:AEC family transporter [Magnetospirillaceae bacterium]